MACARTMRESCGSRKRDSSKAFNASLQQRHQRTDKKERSEEEKRPTCLAFLREGLR